jgi:hypothetical protein
VHPAAGEAPHRSQEEFLAMRDVPGKHAAASIAETTAAENGAATGGVLTPGSAGH